MASAGHSSDGCNVCLWDTLLPHRSAKIQAFSAHDGGSPCLVYSPKHQVIISGPFFPYPIVRADELRLSNVISISECLGLLLIFSFRRAKGRHKHFRLAPESIASLVPSSRIGDQVLDFRPDAGGVRHGRRRRRYSRLGIHRPQPHPRLPRRTRPILLVLSTRRCRNLPTRPPQLWVFTLQVSILTRALWS